MLSVVAQVFHGVKGGNRRMGSSLETNDVLNRINITYFWGKYYFGGSTKRSSAEDEGASEASSRWVGEPSRSGLNA